MLCWDIALSLDLAIHMTFGANKAHYFSVEKLRYSKICL